MTVDRRGWRVRLLTLWLPLGASLFFALFPFYWMAITSLKTNQELYSRKVMPLIVHNPTLKHYVDLLTETSFLEWTWNTFLVAVVSTAISLLFGAMLAYPLARMRFRGAPLLAITVAITYLVPALLALFGQGLAQAAGLAAWLLMAIAFQPILRFYRVSPLWGLALPAIAAAYTVFTVQSAIAVWRGRGGQWKGRAQARMGES